MRKANALTEKIIHDQQSQSNSNSASCRRRGIWEVEVFFFALRTDIKTTAKEEIIACSNFVLSHSRLRVC